MMRHPEHHHVPPNSMQRNRVQPMPPNRGTQPMLMSLQPTVPVPHSGVLVSMPQGAPLIPTSLPQQPQQPKTILQQTAQQVYHYESVSIEVSDHHQPPTQHQVVSEADHSSQIQQSQMQNSPNTSTSSMPQQSTLANTKEKTPMCLINELARYNKIQHQYRLTGEQGPAHKKLFTVTLKLGNEEYESEGPSIKKAQHAAAALALQRTDLKHPPPKTARINRSGLRNTGMVTPTVELNALAMKRGERTVYVLDNVLPHQAQGYMSQTGYYPRHNMYNPGQPRYPNFDIRRGRGYHTHYDRYYGQYRPGYQHCSSEPITLRLRVGDREYPGVGCTVQAARHDAAAKAVEDIKQMETEQQQQQQPQCNPPPQENGYVSSTNGSINQDLSTELKSPISLVHEIALKRSLNVTFEVLSEKGPPHMKIFVTQCCVGDLVATGEGNGKKISKKKAAEKMLEELAKLGPLITTNNNMTQLKRKRVVAKKKTRNLIKVNADKNSEYTEEINPISRLIQIQQANKEKEPVYMVVEERGAPRRREFVIEASVNGHSCTGIGPNKKVAKRKAAEALLNLLGYSNNPSQNAPPKPVMKADKETELVDKLRKVTFMEEKPEAPVGGSGGRQLVPGLLLVGDQSANFQQNKPKVNSDMLNSGSGGQVDGKKGVQSQVSKIPSQATQSVRAKDQLLYLAQLLGVQVQFSDFPKANHEMYLTLVSLGTTPPQVCHGEGPTTEASHEKAALEALNVLSELGLDNVTPNKDTSIEGVQSASKVQVIQKNQMNQNGIKK